MVASSPHPALGSSRRRRFRACSASAARALAVGLAVLTVPRVSNAETTRGASASAPLVATTSAVAPTQTPSSADGTSGGRGLRVASYVSLGVGLVGLAVGVGYAMHAAGKNDEAIGLCRTPDPVTRLEGCADERERNRWRQTKDEAADARTIASAGLVTASLGLVTGVVLLLVSGEDEEPSSRGRHASVEPVVGLGFAGVAGRF